MVAQFFKMVLIIINVGNRCAAYFFAIKTFGVIKIFKSFKSARIH